MLDKFLNSTDFINFGLSAYRNIMKQGYLNKSCTVDPDQMKWSSYNEDDPYVNPHNRNVSHLYLKRKYYDPKHDYQRVFTRIDLMHGFNGNYHIPIHNDYHHCVWNLILYMDDLEPGDGGELILFDKNAEEHSRIIPKKNVAFFFLNGWNPAIHEGAPFNSTRGGPDMMKRGIILQMCTHQSYCRSYGRVTKKSQAPASVYVE